MRSNYTASIKFIEDNIELIENNDFSELYTILKSQPPAYSSIITEKLYEAGIDPLIYLNHIPLYYLAYTKRTSFEIPKNITSISQCAFLQSNLETIIIPEGITFIGSQSFQDCSELKSLSLPNSLKSIATNAFRNCHSLKDITYNGTKEEWQQMIISITAFTTSVTDYKAVRCKDGPITLRTS